MFYLLYIPFGVLPSLIWLLFYLRKDTHPEPKRMILKIFFLGMLITGPAVLAEKGFLEGLKLVGPGLSPLSFSLLYWLVGVGLVEEFLKMLVIKLQVWNSSELDEPVDVMLYMIIAALGFAALENICILLPLGMPFRLLETSLLSGLRFVGATFLHALCSGLLGCFLALSFFRVKHRLGLIFLGLAAAASLHGFYDFFIITMEGPVRLVIPIIILISLALFVSSAFSRLKKIKSVCKIK